MFQSRDQYFIELLVNGQELPIVPGMFEQVLITQNITTFLPSYSLKFYSPGQGGDRLRQIVDGLPISITMGRSLDSGEEPVRAFQFRSFGPPVANMQANQTLYTNVGTLDTMGMKYLRDQPKGVLEGTSVDAISFIAATCGLTPNCPDGTADYMKWILARRSYASIASFICDHGWASDTSMMSLGVDEDKILHYRNLETVIDQAPIATLYLGDSPPETAGGGNMIHVEYFEPRYTSGLNNTTFGYGTFTLQEQLDGGVLEYNDVALTKMSGSIEISAAVKSQIDRVRTEWSPADAGNCHEHFIQAAYQNRRLRSSFSMGMEVTCFRPTNLGLYDSVDFWMNPEVSRVVAEQFNATYFITAKSRCIQANHYIEKLRLQAQGRNTDETGTLF